MGEDVDMCSDVDGDVEEEVGMGMGMEERGSNYILHACCGGCWLICICYESGDVPMTYGSVHVDMTS